MRDVFQRRLGHYLILVVVQLLITLPNLGAHSLWDMDEGVNAEAGREMIESGNWITPFYNYEIRSAKPALLYWLQGASYLTFGVNEFAARFPAVLCGLVTVLLTYELARKMFNSATGLLSGITLASCLEFALISHAATPDPPLIMWTTLTFYLYWVGSTSGNRWWYVPTAAAMGLAVLTKGPVGLGLPALIIVLHLAWMKELRQLISWRTLQGILTFVAVCAPWYILVTLDTKGRWTKAFFLNENVNRFNNPMDNHSAGPWYHVVLLFVLFAPWSVFLIAAVWYGIKNSRQQAGSAVLVENDQPALNSHRAYRYLLVWISVFLVIFSIAATKLPNYILPLYPALAILIAKFLDDWRQSSKAFPKWLMLAGLTGLLATGLITIIGALVGSGQIALTLKGFSPLPSLAKATWIGAIPCVVTGCCFWFLWNQRHTPLLQLFAVGAVSFTSSLGAFVPTIFDEYKVPKYVAQEFGLKQTDRDIRIGTVNWYRHSLVFYAEREVTRIPKVEEVNQWLQLPRPAYILFQERDEEIIKSKVTAKYREIGRRYDFLSRNHIVVITNLNPDGSFIR